MSLNEYSGQLEGNALSLPRRLTRYGNDGAFPSSFETASPSLPCVGFAEMALKSLRANCCGNDRALPSKLTGG